MLFAAPAHAGTIPRVELFTTSSTVPRAELEAALPMFQTAVSRDLAPVWGTDAVLFVGDPAKPEPADMTVTIREAANCWSCLGYHWITAKRQPYALVFDVSTIDSWQLTLTHELFEMLVDPQANRTMTRNAKTWLVEVADPCESGFYAYFIDGVAISDFITPRWYDNSYPGPIDFTQSFSHPGQIGRHGYAAWYDGTRWRVTRG